jgi:Holliday junction resolvase RusA-like endonuclease
MRCRIDRGMVDGTLVLRMFVHDAPHRRMLVHREVLRDYRKHLIAAARRAGLVVPITEPIELKVTFVDPTSPDLGNLYLALENAMDGAIVLDDSLIQAQATNKMYVATEERAPVKLKIVA